MKKEIKNKLNKQINLANGDMVLKKYKKINGIKPKEIKEIEEYIRLLQINLEAKLFDFLDKDNNLSKIEKKYNLNDNELMNFEDKIFDLENLKKEKCKKYKSTQPNNSYTIATAILKSICLNDDRDKMIKSDKFTTITYYNEDTEVENILKTYKAQPNEAIRVLKCLDIIHSKNRMYLLSNHNLYSNSQYRINNNEVLAELMPLLISYVSKTYEATTPNFLEKIDSVIKYIFLNSEAHNKKYSIENEILNNLNNEVEVYTNTHKHIGKLAEIFFKVENNKLLKYVSCKLENEEIIDILISTITDIKLEEEKVENKQLISTNDILATQYDTNTNFEIENKENNSANFIEVIFEVDNIVSDYFDIKPFDTMVQYKTQEELEEFPKLYEFETKPNKFYITVKDSQEQIIAILFNSLEHIKILKAPKSLKEQMLKKIKTFVDKNNIDICKEFCEDIEDNTPNNKPPTSNNANEETSKIKNKLSIKEQMENNKNIDLS